MQSPIACNCALPAVAETADRQVVTTTLSSNQTLQKHRWEMRDVNQDVQNTKKTLAIIKTVSSSLSTQPSRKQSQLSKTNRRSWKSHTPCCNRVMPEQDDVTWMKLTWAPCCVKLHRTMQNCFLASGCWEEGVELGLNSAKLTKEVWKSITHLVATKSRWSKMRWDGWSGFGSCKTPWTSKTILVSLTPRTLSRCWMSLCRWELSKHRHCGCHLLQGEINIIT
jgi:hypothetical protein